MNLAGNFGPMSTAKSASVNECIPFIWPNNALRVEVASGSCCEVRIWEVEQANPVESRADVGRPCSRRQSGVGRPLPDPRSTKFNLTNFPEADLGPTAGNHIYE